MTWGNSNFKNLINKFGLEKFDFKFNNSNNYRIGYSKKDDIYCIVNIDDTVGGSFMKEFYFFKKNENGSFDSINYNDHCYFYYDRTYSKKSKIVKEENEVYAITSSFDAFGYELSRDYLDVEIFKNIYLDVEGLRKLNLLNNIKYNLLVEGLRKLNLFDNYKYHVFKDDRANKLMFEKGKLKSKIYLNQEGYYNRNGGPAVTTYYRNEKVKAQYWCKDDNYHREDGPAKIFYDYEGRVTGKLYYCNGKKVMDEFKLALIQGQENLDVD